MYNYISMEYATGNGADRKDIPVNTIRRNL